VNRFVVILLCFSTTLAAQNKSDYVWLFSFDFTESLDNFEGSIIDFNDNLRSVNYQELPIELRVTNASICDRISGRLLFYTGGCSIIDSSHNVMLNGDQINPGKLHDTWCNDVGSYPQINTSIILNAPNDQNEFYLIHQNRVPKTAPAFGLLYSKVNMTGNNGLGEVVEKNVVLIDTVELKGSYLQACKHFNDEDWWITVLDDSTSNIILMSLNENGIEIVDSIPQQIVDNDNTSSSGHSCFSPHGDKYAWYNKYDGLYVYNFDNALGEFEPLIQLSLPPISTEFVEFFGMPCFSPSGQYIYITTDWRVFQLDLESANIEESLELIALWDGFGDPLPVGFASSLLGPDCKIYTAGGSGTKHLGIIHNPDMKGKSCNFAQHDLELPWHKSSGVVPNLPHFRTNESNPCNDQITSVFDHIKIPNILELNAYPNPASDRISFQFSKPVKDMCTIEIFSSNGSLMVSDVVDKFYVSKTINITSLTDGLYFWRCFDKKGSIKSDKFVKL